MVIEASEFGKIEIEKNERSRSIRVRILPDRLKVTMPVHSQPEDALKFIQSARETIARKQKLAQKKHDNHPMRLDENTGLKTLTFDVKIVRKSRKDVYFSLKEVILTIEFPLSAEINDDTAQKHIWNGISYFMRKEAKRLLPWRTKQLADKHGFIFSDVKIQSSKSRWGSCSRGRSINLSLYLMLLPAHLVDYVILHELCHTLEMNHSDRFWALMDKVTDNNAYDLRQELKKYNMPQ
jgi:predicted metal-dependent hydrolase